MSRLKKGVKLVFISNSPNSEKAFKDCLTDWDCALAYNGMTQSFSVGKNRQEDIELFMEVAMSNCERYLEIKGDEELINLAKGIFSKSTSDGWGNNRLFAAFKEG